MPRVEILIYGFIACVALTYTIVNVLFFVEASDAYTQIYELIREIELLHGKGVDVSGVIRDLNTALELLEAGRHAEAESILKQIRRDVENLKSTADKVHLYLLTTKLGSVIAIACIPVLVYLLLPRLYLYLWYKTRKHWLVR